MERRRGWEEGQTRKFVCSQIKDRRLASGMKPLKSNPERKTGSSELKSQIFFFLNYGKTCSQNLFVDKNMKGCKKEKSCLPVAAQAYLSL